MSVLSLCFPVGSCTRRPVFLLLLMLTGLLVAPPAVAGAGEAPPQTVTVGTPGLAAEYQPGPHLMPAHPDLLSRLGRQEVARLHARHNPARLEADLRELGIKSGTAKVSGTGTCMIIIWDFTDHPADQVNHPSSAYHDLIFSTGTYPTGSMNDFYLENSYGSYGIGGSVVGWTTASNSYWSYANPDSSQDAWTARAMITDAVAELDPSVDFSLYDNDGPDGIPDSGDDDGFVDAFFFVHAGPGQEQSGDPKDIWSHAWVFWDPLWTDDGVAIYRYSVEPEEQIDGDLVTVGVFAHEYGHVLGLPDLYDTDYSTNGIGEWGLMSGGSWTHRSGDDPGSSPSHLTAWCKKELDWITPTTITSTTTGVSIPPAETNAVAYRIFRDGVTTGDEYFLCENRRNIGFDEGLVRRQILLGLPMPEGLAIYHVDESNTSNSNEKHRLVDVVEASPWFNAPDDWYETLDGPRDYATYHNLSQFNRADNGDLWPGFTTYTGDSTDWVAPRDRDRFADDTVPPAEDYFCEATGIAIENITLVGDDVVADFVIGAAKAPPSGPAKDALTWDFEADSGNWEFCRSYVHHDTNHGSGCAGSGGLWFGVDDPEYVCPPGYGNGWNDFTWRQIGVATGPGAQVVIRHKYDMEPSYDYAYIEVRCAGNPGATWYTLATFTGTSSCVTESFNISTTILSECEVAGGYAVLDLRLRFTSDGAWSAEDGDYCGIGWWVDEITIENAITGVDDDLPGLGLPALLQAARPNPFNPSTTIRFHVPAGAQHVSLDVFDQRGRHVRNLVAESAAAGWLEETWDGRDASGQQVASGVYFAKLNVDGVARLMKMALVK